jgi:hypothetical protein
MRLLRNGFTLIELIVLIVIAGLLFALLMPAIQGSGPSDVGHCLNNLKNLHEALAVRTDSLRVLPGYINAIGIEDGWKIRASWVVTTLPYIEQARLWDTWMAGKEEFAPIEILVCPSDPPENPYEPYLSYVANSGYIGDAERAENEANGVFYDRTRTADGAPGSSDERDVGKQPLLQTSLKKILELDGKTMLLSENIHALYWGYVSPKDQQHTKDRSYHFGFCWEQPAVVEKGIADQTTAGTRRINGSLANRGMKDFARMTPEDGFPSSHHPEGVNVVFVSGAVQFFSEQIDPLVYAQLMTSDHRKSDLTNAAGIREKDLPGPKEGDY